VDIIALKQAADDTGMETQKILLYSRSNPKYQLCISRIHMCSAAKQNTQHSCGLQQKSTDVDLR